MMKKFMRDFRGVFARRSAARTAEFPMTIMKKRTQRNVSCSTWKRRR
jgi:hypothetical protein